jgi:thiamine biosynthesis protein ThiI
VVSVAPHLRVLVYRRLMLRIAERLAFKAGAHAVVTGDVIGQVASQTIENLAVVEHASSMTVLRPLVGFDKEEIIAEAHRLGTYDVSVIPDEDCCTLFTPPFPATRARLADVLAAERELDVDALVEAAASAASTESTRFPPLPRPAWQDAGGLSV